LLQVPRVLALIGWRTGGAFAVVSESIQRWGPAFLWVWAVTFSVWCLRQALLRRLDPWRASLLFLVGLYAVTPGLGVQWLIWALPFWIVVHSRQALAYSLLAGAFVAGSYWQWTLIPRYGVRSLTANLSMLSPADLLGIFVVGAVGVLTWMHCVWASWRLLRGDDSDQRSRE